MSHGKNVKAKLDKIVKVNLLLKKTLHIFSYAMN